MFDSIARETSLGAAAPCTSTAPMTASLTAKLLDDAVGVRHQAAHRALEALVQVTEPVVGTLEDGHVCPQAPGHPRRVDTHHPTAQHQDPRRRHARGATRQDAPPAHG